MPAFAFAWLELVSDRLFVNKFLSLQQTFGKGLEQNDVKKKMYYDYKEIIECLYTFLKENMDPEQKSSPALQRFYKATLTVSLMLRNDFPEFMSAFHFSLVNALPPHLI